MSRYLIQTPAFLKTSLSGLMFSQNNAVYVQPIDKNVTSKTVNIVNRPLASYLKNMKVEAKVEELL